MPQPIKYTTTNVNNSVRLGNIALGVNAVEYGPSSTTSWAGGVSVSSDTYDGEYAIHYLSGTTPRVRKADTFTLTTVAGQILGTSTYASAPEALSALAAAGCTVINTTAPPNTVTSGSVFNVNAGLIMSYPRTNSVWYDISGNGYNGTLYNGPTWDSKGWFVFDGTDDYVDTSNTFQFAQSGQFSVCGVINVQDHSFRAEAAAGIIGKGHYYSNSWDVWLYNNERVFFETSGDNSPSNVQYLYSDPLTVGRWYFFAATYNNTSKNLWINGTQYSNTYTGTGGFTNGNNVLIARRPGDAYRSLIGSGSSFSIYSRELSQAEIFQNYYQGNIVTSSLVLALDAGNLVSYGGNGTTVYSLMGSNSSTLTNGVTYSSGYGGNWGFDGTNDYMNFTAPDLGTTTTVEMWCKIGSGYSDKMFFGWYAYDVWCGGGNLGYNTAGGDVYGISAASVSSLGLVNNWKHYVFEMRSDVSYTNNKIYINGVSQTLSQQFGGEVPSNRNFNSGNGRIACWLVDLNYPMPMDCSIFKVYNRALTQQEINQNFNAYKNRYNL